jgi:hypothetical protein
VHEIYCGRHPIGTYFKALLRGKLLSIPPRSLSLSYAEV